MSNKDTSTSNKAPNVYSETLYREICNNIRFTDEMSLRLLGLVPLVSGSGISGIFIVLVNVEMKWSPIFAGISFFGAAVILGLYIWEQRNIQFCNTLVKCAQTIEENEFHFTKEKGHYLARPEAHKKFGIKLGKTIAEKIIYSVTITAWIVAGISALIISYL